jgi:aminoglycoside 6'-N-acetyltransferase
MLGRGHGSRFLKILAERLRAEGAPAVVIDPDVDNLRARQAYRRAGLRGDTIVDTDEGPAVVMTFVGDDTYCSG